MSLGVIALDLRVVTRISDNIIVSGLEIRVRITVRVIIIRTRSRR